MCDNKHDSHYVWTDVTNNSGWTPNGWSFMFGFLSASWAMTDYDATAHIAEEIKNPEIKAPWSIAIALGFTWVGGWLFNIVLAYTMGDPTEILGSPMAQPVAQVFYNVTGRSGGIFFTVSAYIILNFTAMTAIQAGSRTIWAYARDEMLPGSRIWYKINKSTDTPIYATWLFTVCCVLINLIGLGSYTAISAIFNLTAIALDWSYCIPVICKLLYGKFQPGPFHLGKASVAINITAVAWTTFVTIIYVMPTIRPVTKENVSLLCPLYRVAYADKRNRWITSSSSWPLSLYLLLFIGMLPDGTTTLVLALRPNWSWVLRAMRLRMTRRGTPLTLRRRVRYMYAEKKKTLTRVR